MSMRVARRGLLAFPRTDLEAQSTVQRSNLPKEEGLVERVNRAKARWLKRVMYETPASSTERCFAYAVSDHLNAVTLDCWPSQQRLVRLFGFKCAKTIQRAGEALEDLKALRVTRLRSGYRYAPIFSPNELDSIVHGCGQSRPPNADRCVSESFLGIQLESSPRQDATNRPNAAAYDARQRGSLEMRVAELLGRNGFAILSTLAEIDPQTIDRLCRAYFYGSLGERELVAARLAAEQG